jgi:hypothetical protein
MGNGTFKACLQEPLLDKGAVSFRKNSMQQTSEGKYPISVVEKIQIFYKRRKEAKLFKECCESKKEIFNKYFLPSVGRWVDQQELESRNQWKNKINEELNIPEFNPGLKHYKEQNYQNLFRAQPVMFLRGGNNDNNDIYVGHWTLLENQEFQRLGYGTLFRADNTIILGIWNDCEIIGKGRIYLNKDEVFEGEISYNRQSDKYFPNGPGEMYRSSLIKKSKAGRTNTNKQKLQKSDSCESKMISSFVNNMPQGAFKIILPNFTVLGTVENGKYKQFYTIQYNDKSIYEGEVDKNFLKNGNGTLRYENGQIYQGEFKNDQFNGKGLLFTPLINRMSHNGQVIKEDFTKFGEGEYIHGYWLNGKLNGEGSIVTKKKTTSCFWRFGRLIHQIETLDSSNHIKLNENIFTFLDTPDLQALLQVRNKGIFQYFLKDKGENLIKVRLNQLWKFDPQNIYHNELGQPFENHFLRENSSKIKNINDIIANFMQNKTNFIPLIGYWSNGGFAQKRFHFNNMFSPQTDIAYCSNYLKERKNDIVIKAGLSTELVIQSRAKINDEINKKCISQFLFHFDRIMRERLHDGSVHPKGGLNSSRGMVQMHSTNTLLGSITHNNLSLKDISTQYVQKYRDLAKTYTFDYFAEEFTDQKLLNLVQNRNLFFSLHSVLINIPFNLSKYTPLTNPVRTLAIYIRNDDQNISSPIQYQNIKTSLDHTESLKSFLIQNKYELIHTESNDKHIIFEINSQKDGLCCLIQIKSYNDSHIFNLKHFYHIGKFLQVQLIDQSTTEYNFKKTGIDIGTLNCFGEYIELS